MNLKNLRKINKKTQQEIADYLNLNQTSYGRYELETSEPSIETLKKLADYYNVSLDELVGRNFNSDIGHLSQQEKEFVKAYLMLNQQNKIKIAGYALGLLAGQDEDEQI